MPPAQANDYDPTLCMPGDATGTVDYSPDVDLTPADNTFVMDVSCTFNGVAHNDGSYALTLDGETDSDSCAASATATGSGSISGVGPEGALDGTFNFFRSGVVYSIIGTFETGGFDHVFHLTLALQNTTDNSTASVCPFDHADLVGHGLIMDIAEPPPPPVPPNGAFSAEGSGVVSPGLVIPANFDSWSMSGSLTGEFNLEAGECSFAVNGSSTSPETIFSGTWAGVLRCLGTTSVNSLPIDITCAATFTRVTLSFSVSGTCTGTTPGTLTGELSMAPQNFNPTMSYTVAGWLAIA